MRFVHLAPVSAERTILRAGVRGTKLLVPVGAKVSVSLARGVFAMPVVSDFWTTYQWLRELRHWHDERMVAVHFRLPDDEPVYVGRYNRVHEAVTAAGTAAWVTRNPEGAQVIVPRGIRVKEVLRLREMNQLVGWTSVPPSERKSSCLCVVCVPRGARDLMRKVRGAVADALLAAREAHSSGEVRTALGRLAIPLERARGRLSPGPILRYARSMDPLIRLSATALLGDFKLPQVQEALLRLAGDDDSSVRRMAVERLARLVGIRGAVRLLDDEQEEALVELAGLIELEAPAPALVFALDELALKRSALVRAATARAAKVLLSDEDLAPELRPRVERCLQSVEVADSTAREIRFCEPAAAATAVSGEEARKRMSASGTREHH